MVCQCEVMGEMGHELCIDSCTVLWGWEMGCSSSGIQSREGGGAIEP